MRIRSFEVCPDWGSVESMDQKVNQAIVELQKSGVTEFELKVSGTKNTIVYTLVWKEINEEEK